MFTSILSIFFTLVSGLVFMFITPTQAVNQRIVTKPPIIESKAIYLTAYTAGDKVRRQMLVDLINRTELNSVVIDVKDYTGKIFFNADVALADKIGSKEIRIKDLKQWLGDLKKQGIYTIARIVVFQDPYLAQVMPEIALKNKQGDIWRDYKGLSWVDPTQKVVWDYNIDLARQAAKIGFDEVNFDYIRFPSDGNLKQIEFANLQNATFEGKSEVMANFYKYLNEQLEFEPIRTSADVFGMVLWRSDGLNIGQRYQDAASYFDYVSPMVYPSHYPAGFEGFDNPAQHPYEVIYRSLIRAKDLIASPKAKLRPWLQDFNLGATYTPEMIELQKKATYDSGGYGWLLWNASNRYESGGLLVVDF